MVRDAFENPDEALSNKEELSKVLDCISISQEVLFAEIKEAMTSTVVVKDVLAISLYSVVQQYQGEQENQLLYTVV